MNLERWYFYLNKFMFRKYKLKTVTWHGSLVFLRLRYHPWTFITYKCMTYSNKAWQIWVKETFQLRVNSWVTRYVSSKRRFYYIKITLLMTTEIYHMATRGTHPAVRTEVTGLALFTCNYVVSWFTSVTRRVPICKTE